MPKININGITRDMTPEEIEEFERQAAEVPGQTKTALEQRVEELEGALELLIGGAT